jgi:hypothetical protein
MSETKDTSRPKVTVKMPEIRLKLEDLAYLRSLGQEKAIRCHPGPRVKDKLRFLDLIARANVTPSPERTAELNAKIAEVKLELNEAVAAENWKQAERALDNIGGCLRELRPVEDDVLTDKGRALLLQGEVQVKVRKVGCV